ncbi:MAG: helix-turn-helix transcriptional regulator [Terracidiphilus sp.]
MANKTTTAPICILRAKEVRERTGLSRSTIFLKIRRGEFPAGVSLGDRAVGWRSNEVDEWIASRVAVRPQPLPGVQSEPPEQAQCPPTVEPGRKPPKAHGRIRLAEQRA